jgi:hypothetical protein
MKPITLHANIHRALLQLSVKSPEGATMTLGDMMSLSRGLTLRINSVLEENALVDLAAKEALKAGRMRGPGKIKYKEGSLVLVRGAKVRKIKTPEAPEKSSSEKSREADHPRRLRDEVRTSTPLPDVRLPRRR